MDAEQFYARATAAILARRDKYEAPALDALQREFAAEDAKAALEAVGAWEMYQREAFPACVRCCHLSGHHDVHGTCHVSIQITDTVFAGKSVRGWETCKCAGYLVGR